MAEQPIKGSDIIANGVFENTIKGADLLIAKLKETEDGFRANLEVTKQFISTAKIDSSAAIKENAQATKDATANLLALEKVQQETIKAEKLRLQVLQEAEKVERERIKTSQQASKAEQQYNKEIEKTAKASKQATSEYKQASDALNILSKRQKDNVIAGREMSRTARLVAQAHDELRLKIDKADHSVQDFRRNVGNYPKELKAIQRELAGLEPGTKRFDELAKKAGVLKDKIGDAKDAIKAYSKESKSGQAKDLFGQTLDSIKNLDFKDASDKAKQFGTVIKSISFAETIAGAKDFGKAIIDTGKAILSTPIGIFLASITAIVAGVKLYRDTVNFAYEAQSNLNKELRESNLLLEQGRAAYQKSVNQGLLLNGKISESEKKIKDITIDANLKKTESYNKYLDSIKETLADEETSTFQKKAAILRISKDYALQNFNDSRKNVQDIKNVQDEAANKEKEELKKKFDEEKKLRDEQNKERIKQIRDNNKALQDELDKLKIEDIRNSEIREIQSAELENKLAVDRVKNTQANEEIKNRLLVELEINLNQKLFDIRKKFADERRVEEEKIAKEKIEAEKKTDEQILKSGQNNIDAANERLANAKAQEEKKSADRKAKQEKNLKDAIEFEKQLIDAIAKAEAEKSALKQAGFDKQIADTDKNIETQKRLAEKGANNTLAEEEANKVKLERQKEEEKQQEIKRQKALAFFKLFASYAEKDPDTALTKALRDTVLAEAVSAAFIDGTENVGKDKQFAKNKFSNGTDGYVARFDGDERILNPEQNKKIGNLSNESLADLAYRSRNGLLDTAKHAIVVNADFASKVNDSAILQQNAALIKELQEVKQAINDKPVPHFAMNQYHEFVLTTIENGFIKNRTFKNRKSRIC